MYTTVLHDKNQSATAIVRPLLPFRYSTSAIPRPLFRMPVHNPGPLLGWLFGRFGHFGLEFGKYDSKIYYIK
jgi:hypothetical protein